jgi:hypothetical protein
MNCKLIVELVVMALRAFDGKQPCVGRAWLVMKNIGMTYLIITRSIIIIIIEFCKCD